MLIRSQNKAVLLNFSNLDAIYTVKDGDDFIISSLEDENKCTLGKYSTKEKGLETKWKTGEDVFRRWMNDDNLDGQMELSDFIEY